MKAALYIRVSTDAQDVNRQVSDLTARAISDGNEIINVFQDKISGFKNELQREGLAELLNLTSDDVQLIYISELSRLSRNPTYLKVLVDQFTNKGINLFFLSQNINTLNKDGKTEFTTALLISILSEYSAYEITLKNQRSKSGKKEAIVNKGNAYSYKPAYGYKNVDKKLLIEPTEAAIISEIFQRYADGKSVREIVQWLNLTGAPTRNTSFMKKESYSDYSGVY